MIKINKTCIVILAAFLLSACSMPKDFPKETRLCGNYFISCTLVKKGMYRCKVYSRWRKQLIVDSNYIYPFFYQNLNELDMSKKVTGYAGDIIYFDGSKKLLRTDMSEDVVFIQSLKDGVWLSCKLENEKKNIYVCIIYDAKGANILSSGRYVLKRFYWDTSAGRTIYQDQKKPVKNFNFVYYGGVGISLRDKMVLLPEGWVDYPNQEGKRGGLRVKYGSQAIVLKEEDY